MAEKEYIDKQDAIKEIYRFDGYLDDDMIWRLHYAIFHLPTADVEPVVRGKWEQIREYCWACSVCKAENNYAYRFTDDLSDITLQDFYCPNCGADMRGEDDE